MHLNDALPRNFNAKREIRHTRLRKHIQGANAAKDHIDLAIKNLVTRAPQARQQPTGQFFRDRHSTASEHETDASTSPSQWHTPSGAFLHRPSAGSFISMAPIPVYSICLPPKDAYFKIVQKGEDTANAPWIKVFHQVLPQCDSYVHRLAAPRAVNEVGCAPGS